MTDEQIRFYVELRCRVHPDQRIRTWVEDGRFLCAKTTKVEPPQSLSTILPRSVRVELRPDEPLTDRAIDAAALTLAGYSAVQAVRR